MPRVGKAGVVALDLERPTCVVVLQHGHGGPEARTLDNLANVLQLVAHLLDFRIAPARLRVMIEDAMPVLLSAEARRPPAKVDDGVRTVRDGLVGPQADLARPRRHADHLPASRSRLLLHDPEVLTAGTTPKAAHSIVAQGRGTGVHVRPHAPL